MDKNLVTKSLWDTVKAWNGGNGYGYDNPGAGKATNHPVQTVNWYDVVKWCNERSEMEGLEPCYYADTNLALVYRSGQVTNPGVKWSASGYRLPTEAEWEKAARGGASGHRFPWSDLDSISHSRANYFSATAYFFDLSPTRGYQPVFNDGVLPYTSPVGYFGANGYGLYDMAGNVWEWCGDWYGSYTSDSQTDPRGPASGWWRVVRGGSWGNDAIRCRSANRYSPTPTYTDNNFGFRCVRRPTQ
jgi:formylglycine-generating enzyme required for sulfatase activity